MVAVYESCPCLSLEAEAIRALGAEPRLQEHASSASQLGWCRKRGMLISRTSPSLLSCRANSVVGFEHEIHVEVLYSRKKKHTPKKLLKLISKLELKECIFSVRNN